MRWFKPLVYDDESLLTFILSNGGIGYDIAEDLAVGFDWRLPADLEAVHGDLGEAEVGWRSRNALKCPRINQVGLWTLASRVEGRDGDGVVGVHVKKDQGVRGLGG